MRQRDNREKSAAEENPGNFWAVSLDWLQALVVSVIFVALCFTFGVRIVGVDGESMEPTLCHNDRILVLSSIWSKPRNGDVVVLRKDSFVNTPVVKRIIATEGQTIDIDYSTGAVYLDGVLLDEPYIKEKTLLQGDMEFPVTVSPGCVFVMGDNRNASTDSRWSSLGEVDCRYILGKAVFVLFPGRDEDGKMSLARIGGVK